MRYAAALASSVILVGLAGCASGPTVDDAQELLANGDPDAALLAVRAAERKPLDAEKRQRARRIAFEASLALGRTDEAARELLSLRVAPRERDRLREKLAGGTLRAALDGADGGRRARAATELGLAGAHPDALALDECALRDREPIVRLAALGTVSRFADPVPAAERLARALDDADADVREAAALALAARLGRPRPGEPAELAAARAALLKTSTCPEALALVGARPVESVVPALEREEAATVASLVAGKRYDLIARGLTSREAETRRRSWLALDGLEPFSADKLRAALADGDPAIAPDAARLLAERAGPQAVPALVATLDDPLSPARIAAARALGALGGPDAVPALLHALRAEDGALRRAAAEGLARSANAGALDELARAIAAPRDDSDLAAAAAVLAIEARTGGSAANSSTRPQEGP